MTRAELLRYLKSSGSLYLNKVGRDVWWTDSYVAAPVGAVLSELLGDYNLIPEPMCCTVGRTITRDKREAPAIAKLVKKSSALIEAEQKVIGTHPVLIESGMRGRACELWCGGEVVLAVDRAKREVVEDCWQEGSWWVQATDVLPMVRVDGSRVVGLVMPVRSLLSAADLGALAGLEAAA